MSICISSLDAIVALGIYNEAVICMYISALLYKVPFFARDK